MMIAWIKCLLLFSGLVFIGPHVYSQRLPGAGSYSRVLLTEQSCAPDKNKLADFYKIKQEAEKNGNTADTGYYLCLVKTAKYESIVNDNKEIAIRLSIEALHVNKLLKKPVNRSLLINTFYNLATYYQYLQQENNALASYDTTLMLCGSNDPDDYILLSRYQRTIIYFSLGDLQKVIEESTSGIAEAKQRTDLYHLTCFLNFRASAYLHQNQQEEAAGDVEKAIQNGRSINNPYGYYELANSFKVKAQLFQKQKDYTQAEFYYKEAIKIRPRDTAFWDAVAVDYNDIGSFYLNSIHDITKAKESFRATVLLADKLDEAKRALFLTMAYENLGEACCKEGKLKESLAYYQLACHAKSLNTADFLFEDIPLIKLSSIEYKDIVYSLVFGRTELLYQYYRQTRQESYLKACLQAAVIADEYITRARHENLGENSKLYWRNQTRAFFNTAIDASYDLQDTRMAFYFMENSRAVLLNDKWNEMKAASYLSPQEALEEEKLRIRIIEEQQALSQLKLPNDEFDRAENRLLESRNNFEHFTRFLEKKYPHYYQSKYSNVALSLTDVQNQLGKQRQSFVYYYTSDSATYALSVAGKETRFIKIPFADFDPRSLSDFLQLCSDKQSLNRNYAKYISLSQHIYNKLFRPLRLQNGNIVICTDNFFIPFEALCTDKKGSHFLIYDFSFSYAYSMKSFLKPYTNTGNPLGNFAGFAPVSFSHSLQVYPLLGSSDALVNSGRYYSTNTLFTQQQATRHNFMNQASRYTILTVFSHAQADTTGMEPFIYMQDSLIYLSELQKLNNLSTQFVLLSACQTNIGRNATGEGVYSLARGFAAAGIPSVSATQWKADEETTYEISEKFNEYLSKGMNKSEALQQAKLWYLQNSSREHTLPYYWANMVLIGSTNPILLQSSEENNKSFIWIVAGLILVPAILLAAFICRRRIVSTNKAENA